MYEKREDKLKYIGLEILCILVSLYLTAVIDRITLTTQIQAIFVYLYFLCGMNVLLYIYFKIYKTNKQKIMNRKWEIVLGVVMALFLFAASKDNWLTVYKEGVFEIQSLQEQNELSNGREIWIKQIKIGGNKIEPSSFELPKGWYETEGGEIVSYGEGEPFRLNYKSGQNFEITFVKHAWCGKIRLIGGGIEEEIDLYQADASDQVESFDLHVVDGKIDRDSLGEVIGLFLLLFFLSYLLVGCLSKKNISIGLSIFYAIFILYGNFIDSNIVVILVLLSLPFLWKNFMECEKTKRREIIFAFIAIYASLACVGRRTIFLDERLKISTTGVLLLIGFSGYTLAWIHAFYRFFLKCFHLPLAYEIRNYTIPLPKYQRRDTAIKIFICTLVAVFFSLLLDDYIVYQYQNTEIEIIATGEKGNINLGNEILIDRINADGKDIDLTQVNTKAGWKKFGENSLLYNEFNQQEALTIELPQARDIKVYFYMYEVAGKGKIKDGNKITEIDFSSNDHSYLNHFFIYEVNSNRIQTSFLLLAVKYFVLFGISFLLCWGFLTIGRKRVRKDIRYTEVAASQRVFYTCFILEFFLLGIWMLAFFPGNWSWDNLYQWAQATGMTPLSDGHPLLMTLGMRILLKIYRSPVTIMLFLNILASIIGASVMTFFYKKGMRARNIWIALGIFSCLPSTIVMITNPLKDTFHTLAVIYTIFLLVLILWGKKEFERNIYYKIALPFSLASMALLRHEAIIIFVIAIVILEVVSFKRKNIMLTCIAFISVFLVIGFQEVTKNMVESSSTQSSMTHPMYRGLASVLYNGKELDESTEDYMRRILPLETWKELYDPYNLDLISFDERFLSNVEKEGEGTLQILKMYIKELVRHPGILLMDRLNGSDLMWNIPENEKYHTFYGYDGVMTFYMIGPNELGLPADENGVYQTKNVFSDFVRSYIKWSQNGIGRITWSVGISIVVLFLISYMAYEQKIKIRAITFLVWGRVFTWLLVLNWPHYRYIYSIFIATYMITALFILCKRKE